MPRILIIDDDAAVRTTVVHILRRAGYETLEAADGRDGSRLLDGVDLVITDLLMPEMDGVDVLAMIRKAGHTMPVIAMSGGGKVDSKSYLDVAKALGAYATIAKPFDLEHLLATVRDAIASKSGSREI
jgi:DNA-binding NtrC family response regulator